MNLFFVFECCQSKVSSVFNHISIRSTSWHRYCIFHFIKQKSFVELGDFLCDLKNLIWDYTIFDFLRKWEKFKNSKPRFALNLFFFCFIADGKDTIKNSHGKRHSMQKIPIENVYHKDHEKRQHRKSKGWEQSDPITVRIFLASHSAIQRQLNVKILKF